MRDQYCSSRYRIRAAAHSDLDTLAALLCGCYRQRQLAPVWDRATLTDPSRCRGLTPGDFLIVEHNGAPVGCLAVWDQRAFKQIVVHAYRPPLSWLRGVANVLGPALGTPRLPAAGTTLNQGWITHVALDPAHADATIPLVGAALVAARERGLDHLLMGLAPTHFARDALARRFRALVYRSALYLVHWPEDRVSLPDFTQRPLHVETATL